MFLEEFRASRQRPFPVGLARSRVSATMSCRLQPTFSRETSSTTRSWPHVRGHRWRSAAMVGSLVKCRSAFFNPGGGYRKTLGAAVAGLRVFSLAQIMWKSECKMNYRLGDYRKTLALGSLQRSYPGTVELESMDQFLKRLWAAVRWANSRRSEQLWYLSTNQKERAEDCLCSNPPGARTKW